MPHARSNDDIALHRHTVTAGRPESGGYNRNLHTTPIQRASSASQTPAAAAGPSATSTPNSTAAAATKDANHQISQVQPPTPRTGDPATIPTESTPRAASMADAATSHSHKGLVNNTDTAAPLPDKAQPGSGGLRHSRMHQSLLDQFTPDNNTERQPLTAANSPISATSAADREATESPSDIPPGQRTPPSPNRRQRQHIPVSDNDITRRHSSGTLTPDIFSSHQEHDWDSEDRSPPFGNGHLPRYDFYDRHQLPPLSQTERNDMMLTAIEGLQTNYGALIDRLATKHHSTTTTPDRARSLSPKRQHKTTTPNDVSDMVNHMLDTFTTAQKQLLASLNADFKRVMIQTTSQLTSDFLSHLDQIMTRTDRLEHSWAHFRQTQAAADKRADQQIRYLKQDQKEDAKHIALLQQENAAIIHDMQTMNDHRTDTLKKYVKEMVYASEKHLTDRQEQALRQLCHTLDGQARAAPTHTQTAPSYGTVQDGVYTPTRRTNTTEPSTTPTQAHSITDPRSCHAPTTGTNQSSYRAVGADYTRQPTSGIDHLHHGPPGANHLPLPTAADPAFALAGKLADLIEKMADRPRSTRRDAPKISAPTFNGAQDSSFETWKSSLEDTFTYLQWPSDDPQRLALLPTVLQDYAKVHYNSMPPADKATYDIAIANLAKAFSIAHQPPTTRAARLQRPQGATESVRDFNLEITRRLQECNITDGDRQLDIYIQNLRDEISQRVLLMLPTTLRQAQICAETVEHSLAITSRTPILAVNQPSPHHGRDNGNYRSNSRGYQNSNNRSRYDNYNQRNYRSQSRDRRPDSRQSRDRRQRSSSYNNRRESSRDRYNSRPRQRSNSDQRRGQYSRSPSYSRNRYDRSPTPHINAIQDDDHITKN